MNGITQSFNGVNLFMALIGLDLPFEFPGGWASVHSLAPEIPGQLTKAVSKRGFPHADAAFEGRTKPTARRGG
jgi:hypothetical protein